MNRAFDHLAEFAMAPERYLRFAVSCGGGMRGVYLRENHQLQKPHEIPVTVEPVYIDEYEGEDQLDEEVLWNSPRNCDTELWGSIHV